MSLAGVLSGLSVAAKVVGGLKDLADEKHEKRGYTLTQSREAASRIGDLEDVIAATAAAAKGEIDGAEQREAREQAEAMLDDDRLPPMARKALAAQLALQSLRKAGL